MKKTNYADLSLKSVSLMLLMTTIHHVYRLGFMALIPFLIVIIVPFVLLQLFYHSQSKYMLWGYVGFNSLTFLWFGLMDGFLDHVLKSLGIQNFTFLAGSDVDIVKTAFTLGSEQTGHLFYEGTGILAAIVGFFAIYYTYRFLMETRASSLTVANAH